MQNFNKKINNAGLKATPRRIAILNIMEKSCIYLSPEEIWNKMKSIYKHIGLPTVYRILNELTETRLIYQIIHTNRQLYYFFCSKKSHHHHFICETCRTVHDIDFCNPDNLNKIVINKLKGKMLSHLIQVNGVCEKCLVR